MRKTLIFIFVALLVPALAMAQAQRTGKVLVQVTNEDGGPVAGALISVEGTSLQGTREGKSDENGSHLFGLLPPGNYRVVVSAPGMKTLDFSFPLGVGQTIPLSPVMTAGQDITEEIVVRGALSRMQTTANGESFDLSSTVEELPIQSRRLEDIAAYSPNIAAGPTSGSLQISGANSFDTVVLLDGAELSDPYFGSAPVVYIEDAIQEIQVLTSGISARYGRFAGGVINAISKVGGNTFDGAVRAELDQDSWDDQTPFDEQNDVKQESTLNKVYLGSLGGYIVKDHLWFFGALWNSPATSDAISTSSAGIIPVQQVAQSSEQDRMQLKLRGAITSNHVLEGSWLDFEQTTEPWTASSIPSGEAKAAGRREDIRELLTFTYQGVLTPSLFLDLQATDKEVGIAAGGDPNLGSPFLDFVTFRFLNNMWWDITDKDDRSNETLSANLTYTLGAGSTTHTIEGGIMTLESQTGGDNKQTSSGYNWLSFSPDMVAGYDAGTMNVLYNLYPGQPGANIIWEAIPLNAAATIDYNALYVQDTIEYDKWRFDVGLRFEEYDGEGPLNIQTVNFDSIAPRAGVTYNIDQNWQLQATYGIYQGRFNDNISGEASGVGAAPFIERQGYIGPSLMGVTGSAIDTEIRNAANWSLVTDFTSPGFETVITAPDIESPYARDITFAIKRALPNNTGTVSFTAQNRSFKGLLDDQRGLQVLGGMPGEIKSVVFMGTNFGDFDQNVWDNRNDAEREYNALTATWDYRPGTKWNLGGSYTWSELKGNYVGEGTNQPASGSNIGDYPITVPGLAIYTPSGRLPGDITHRLRTWGNYRFDFGRGGSLSLGGLLRFTEGDVYSLFADDQVTRPINDSTALQDDDTEYDHYFSERGAFRFNNSWALDFSARYQVPIWRDLSAWVKVNVLNVLNLDKLQTFQTAVNANTFDVPYVFEDGTAVDSDMDGTQDMVSAGVSGYDLSSSFGQATESADYQTPRTYLLTVGFAF